MRQFTAGHDADTRHAQRPRTMHLSTQCGISQMAVCTRISSASSAMPISPSSISRSGYEFLSYRIGCMLTLRHRPSFNCSKQKTTSSPTASVPPPCSSPPFDNLPRPLLHLVLTVDAMPIMHQADRTRSSRTTLWIRMGKGRSHRLLDGSWTLPTSKAGEAETIRSSKRGGTNRRKWVVKIRIMRHCGRVCIGR